jgi:hypothetical protein
MLLHFDDPLIKSDAIACYQHLHLFAPRYVELNGLVLKICVSLHALYIPGICFKCLNKIFLKELLSNPNVILRKSAVACLRQLLQRETKEVREHVKSLIPSGLIEEKEMEKREGKHRILLPETGVEGLLFEMLDTETDPDLRKHIKVSHSH